MSSTESLRSFRRNAVHVRQALELLHRESGRVQVDAGYLEAAGVVERYKRLSIPVRRALNPTDRASFTQAIAALGQVPNARRDAMVRIDESWQSLQQELDTTVVFGGAKVPRRQILTAWLEAAAFYDTLERDRAYDHVIDQYGKAAESIGAELTETAARLVLTLDEEAAAALGEPLILPPPPKTPPPPPDPKEPLWRRLFRRRPSRDD
jgi:hypothetical protein